MRLKEFIPSPAAMSREAIAVFVGVVVTAWIISKFPQLKTFVVDNSVTIRDGGPFLNEN